MARTVTEIKASITSDFMNNETLAAFYGFVAGSSFDDTFSKVSFESILFYIIAMAIFVIESLFDVLKSDVDTALAERLTHNRQWYVNASKAFQYGFAFNDETGVYDTIDEISMIVSYASVTEVNGTLNIKIAKTEGEGLAAIDDSDVTYPGAKTNFEVYMMLKKDAGVKLIIISGPGDDLRLAYDIFYDPLVLDGDGKLLTNSSVEPARDALKAFIKNLPFNGEFIPTSLTDALQLAAGIKIPVLLSCETRYGTDDFNNVDGKATPYSGYMIIADVDLMLNYRPYDAN